METVHAELPGVGKMWQIGTGFNDAPHFAQTFAESAERLVGAVRHLGDLAEGLFVEPAHDYLALGVADGVGSVEWVARDVIKAESIVDYPQKSNPVERIAKRFGAAAAKSFADFTLRESIRLR